MRAAIAIALLSSLAWADAAVPTTKGAAKSRAKLHHYIVPAARAPDFYPADSRSAKPSYFTPSAVDVARLESSLADGVRTEVSRLRREAPSHPPEGLVQGKPIWQQLDRFDLQYVGVDIGGKRRIWVNAFCRDASTRIDRPLFVDDGGACFWRIYFYPDSGALSEYEENGDG